jgi:UDP-N-acetylglucosamine 2-epimerase (non-hydrolysing)
MAAVEAYVAKLRPGGLVVAGDSDQTLACALAADRLGVPIARLGAGLRCHDWSLREEVNRVLLDTLADLLLTDHPEAGQTLAATGAPVDRIRCVGSTLADLALASRKEAVGRRPWEAAGLTAKEYVLITLHRRENVADEQRARRTLDAIIALAKRVPVLLVLDRASSRALAPASELDRLRAAGVRLSAPLDHLDFLGLEACAGAVVTDSAGVQEETTALGVPCYTLRATSERVVTLTEGTNTLVGDDPADIAALRPSGPGRPPVIPYWDGDASVRVADELVAWLEDAQ